MTRAEHLDWCKRRAIELLDRGLAAEALASFQSDVLKHEDTAKIAGGIMGSLGLSYVIHGNDHGLRSWIEGWN